MRTTKRYGWKPQIPDSRDFRLTLPKFEVLPSSVDLRPGLPACFDQGQLGSCTSNAIAGALMFEMGKDKSLPTFMPSRLYIYYQERLIEGDVTQDSGAQIRDGIKAVAKFGVPSETDWPYVESEFATRPSVPIDTEAEMFNAFTNKKILYEAVDDDLNDLKTCLATGWPFVFGFTVYPAFESDEVARTGIVPMPEGSPVGGHAVLAVGYDDSKQAFLVRNSWGNNWGIGGYFYLPYGYLADMDDAWKVSLVPQTGA